MWRAVCDESRKYGSGRGFCVFDYLVIKCVVSYFTIEDIEGIEFQIPEMDLKPNEKIAQCESIIENMPKRPELRQINANRACYAPELDFVNMPSNGKPSRPFSAMTNLD